jgi:uncharacterized membrane protein
MNGRAYPRRLNPLWDKSQSSITGHISYLKPCTIWTLVVVFFAFCMVGWVWEVALNLIRFGQFSNRGMLHGPWLPIYGAGVVMIAVLLNRFRSKPVLEALAIIVLCGLVEYMTSFVTEQITGLRWWDYTGYFLNLHGRICGEGLVVFFAFCMVGWFWEVALDLVRYGKFANRGMLHGPWLPIYGSGVVMIAVLLNRFRSKPALEAVMIVLLCGFVEFMTSLVVEKLTGMRWWDYSGYFLNLQGRICGEGLVVFMLGGMVAVYFLVPLIDSMTMRVKPKLLVAVCLVLTVCFTVDLVYSCIHPNTGDGITRERDMIQAAETAPTEANAQSEQR